MDKRWTEEELNYLVNLKLEKINRTHIAKIFKMKKENILIRNPFDQHYYITLEQAGKMLNLTIGNLRRMVKDKVIKINRLRMGSYNYLLIHLDEFNRIEQFLSDKYSFIQLPEKLNINQQFRKGLIKAKDLKEVFLTDVRKKYKYRNRIKRFK